MPEIEISNNNVAYNSVIDNHKQQIDNLNTKVRSLTNELEITTNRLNELTLSYYNMLSYYKMYGDLNPHFTKKIDILNDKKKKITICSWFSSGSFNNICLDGFGWKLVKYTESGKMVIKRRKQYKYINLTTKEIEGA